MTGHNPLSHLDLGEKRRGKVVEEDEEEHDPRSTAIEHVLIRAAS